MGTKVAEVVMLTHVPTDPNEPVSLTFRGLTVRIHRGALRVILVDDRVCQRSSSIRPERNGWTVVQAGFGPYVVRTIPLWADACWMLVDDVSDEASARWLAEILGVPSKLVRKAAA